MQYVVPEGVQEISITFGSCFTDPNSPVVLYKNGIEEEAAEMGETKTKKLSVSKDDTIQIRDMGTNSVVRIDEIEVCEIDQNGNRLPQNFLIFPILKSKPRGSKSLFGYLGFCFIFTCN